ncbi:transcription initiation factor TFIID subunit 8-like isoform X2 [Cucurbita pepo subsp. pepo]|uniref:transcription initiation factor TFIID subunit 8-like isoform X2 n=1 Tax=Cucurbita pepo subsp. pepo TaxID=3664 RepID=UPI000C9D37FB|nr:transcription initiation factor TFIID subunit 8-like isoform X2 [Cucurbita pepo subsp. pepo]
MSDGARNNMKSKEQQSSDSRKCRGNEFGREVSRIAVAQICNSAGFHRFKESALDALVDIAIKYLRHLGKIAALYANLAGRIECNVFDIIRGLEELESSQGFQEAWEPIQCLANSGNRKAIPSFLQIGETPPGKHIADWLPAFPDAHTYDPSTLWRRSPSEPCAEKMEMARQRRKAEKSVSGLQKRLVSCGSARNGNGEIELSGGESNPFLGTCLQEMEDGTAMDGISHLSVPEVVAPAIEAINGCGLAKNEDDKARILPIERPPVRFKLETSKTFLRGSRNLNAKMAGNRESVFWVRRDDERDEKKRRVEYIPRHSQENSHEELNQS